ncbi:MAG: hypothetical protein KDC98_09330, partial [Planctomycetes bacterium]|nr:hypothetical protein [Planctomycetota bacterium]
MTACLCATALRGQWEAAEIDRLLDRAEALEWRDASAGLHAAVKAGELAQTAGMQAQFGRACATRIRHLTSIASFADAEAAYRDGLAAADGAHAERIVADLQVAFARAEMRRGHVVAATELAVKVPTSLCDRHVELERKLVLAQGNVHQGNTDRALETLFEVAALADDGDPRVAGFRADAMLTIATMAARQGKDCSGFAAARDHCEQTSQLVERYGLRWARAALILCRGMVLLLENDRDGAGREFEAARAAATEFGDRLGVLYSARGTALLCAYADECDRAR